VCTTGHSVICSPSAVTLAARGATPRTAASGSSLALLAQNGKPVPRRFSGAARSASSVGGAGSEDDGGGAGLAGWVLPADAYLVTGMVRQHHGLDV
jgi:hypothetical protein